MYPCLDNIRQITTQVAAGVVDVAVRDGITKMERPACGWSTKLKETMWWPHYEEYV